MEGVITTTEKQPGWFRVLRTRREILGLTQSTAASLTGLSPTTLRRAEEDEDWHPTSQTIAAIARVFGDGWQDVGWSVVEAEREEQAAVERVQHILSRLAQPAYRRKGAQRGAAQAVTLALFGNPLPYLLLSMLLHDEGAALPAPLADAEPLSWEDERELGFPERRYGEPVQRTAGVLQGLWRAAVRYAEVVLADPVPGEGFQALMELWDRLDEAEEDDLSAISPHLTMDGVRAELRLHRTGWGSVIALQAGAPLTPRQERYVGLFGASRPKVAGAFWQAIAEWEDDLVWERKADAWSQAEQQMADEEDSQAAPPLDQCLVWALAVPPDLLQETLGFDPNAVDLDACVRRTRQQILARLETAAKWAAIESGTAARGWHRFLRKIVVLCRGGKTGEGKLIRGLGLNPRMLAQRVDLKGLFDVAALRRTQEQALWRAVEEWIAHPFGPSAPSTVSRLALAAFSLLPEPPVAEKVLMPQEDAERVARELAPLYLDTPDPERLLRLVKGVIKGRKGNIPLFALERKRREELALGTRAALMGKGEQSTAGRMARAVLHTLPKPIRTGVALCERDAQWRLQKGLPYFFPAKRAGRDRLAEARRVVLSAVQ